MLRGAEAKAEARVSARKLAPACILDDVDSDVARQTERPVEHGRVVPTAAADVEHVDGATELVADAIAGKALPEQVAEYSWRRRVSRKPLRRDAARIG